MNNLTVITLEQDVRYGFSEFAPAQQVSLPLGLRDLYEIGGRKSGGFGQHRPGDGYGIVPCVLPYGLDRSVSIGARRTLSSISALASIFLIRWPRTSSK